MRSSLRTVVWAGLVVAVVGVFVSLPFILVGEEAFTPLLDALKAHPLALTSAVVVLLALDAFLPVPSAWVIILLAQQAGRFTGLIGGAAGLSLGVLVSAWVGRHAVGRLAPRFIPAAELERLRVSVRRHTGVTLACMRSVPVLAETSVMIAAAAGVSLRRILGVTLAPNVAIAAVYSFAAVDSFGAACIAFFATTLGSYAIWRLHQALVGPGDPGD